MTNESVVLTTMQTFLLFSFFYCIVAGCVIAAWGLEKEKGWTLSQKVALMFTWPLLFIHWAVRELPDFLLDVAMDASRFMRPKEDEEE